MVDLADADQFSPADLRELDRLTERARIVCETCGATVFDFTRTSDADLDRMLAILRPVFAPALKGLL